MIASLFIIKSKFLKPKPMLINPLSKKHEASNKNEKFEAYNKNVTYNLHLSNEDCVKYSCAGYIIGQKGWKLK